MYYSFRPECARQHRRYYGHADFLPEWRTKQQARSSGFSGYSEPAWSGFTESCDARPKARLIAGLRWLQSSSFSSPQTCEEDSGLGVRRCGRTHHRRGAIHARSSGPHPPRHRHLGVGGKVRSHGGNPGHTLPGEGARVLCLHDKHYLDDFIVLDPAGSSKCHQALDSLISLCERLGVPLAPHKLENPTTCLIFLGIEVDSVASQLRLPSDKLARIRQLISEWRDQKAWTWNRWSAFSTMHAK